MLSIQQASVQVGRQIGLSPDFDGSIAAINSLGTDDKLHLTYSLGAFIRANPTEFTQGQVTTAQTMVNLSAAPLANAHFSVTAFLTETANNADNLILEPLVNVGQSVSTVARITPLIVILIGGFLLYSWTKGKAASLA